MDLGIRNKKVIVTAASRGIGYATAKRFLEEGASVLISSHDEQKLLESYNKLKDIGEVYYLKADLRSVEEIKRLITKGNEILNGIDVFVYVAGSPKPGNIFELSDSDWEEGFKLLLMSAIVSIREVSRFMKNNGRIILSTSISIKQPLDNLDLSNVIRLSLAGLIKSASKQLASKGILVNGIVPGWTLTERVYQLVKDRCRRENKSESTVINEIVKDVPLGRMASPEEVANVIIFLASELSTYITGALIPVDGGYLKATF
jgi:3-oxoacyl-[acyl-carrier protein] reductase